MNIPVGYVPEDNDHYREIYEPEGKGICGLAVIAVLKKITVKETLDLYAKHFGQDYKGYLPLKDLRMMLKNLGYKTLQHNGRKSKAFPSPQKDGTIIARIQWTGNDGGDWHGYNSWQEATCNTHWILIKEFDGEVFVFCNGDGWFIAKDAKEYLELGYVTSYLEVLPE